MATVTHSFTARQKMSKSTLEIFHYLDSDPREVAVHQHDFYEIYFYISGNITYIIDDRSYRLNPGDILLVCPGQQHQPVFPAEKQSYERYVLWVNPSFVGQSTKPGQDLTRCFDRNLPGHTGLLRPDGVTREVMNYLLQMMVQEQESQEYGAEMYCLGLLSQLLVLVNRVALRAAQEPEPRENAGSVVMRVAAYINDHYNEDLTLDFLANRFFVSKYHLSREFQKIVGLSVHRYIIQRRLLMARQMMAGGVPMSQVYQHCGFGDYSNFYRAFKGEYKMSPRAYLESLKQEAEPQALSRGEV